MNLNLKALIIGIGIILSILISGCVEEPQQKPINTSSSTPFFPVQNYPSEFSMTALLEGKLALEDGCLRVSDRGYDNYLLVWPYGFSLSTEGGVIQIMDDTDRPIVRVGDELKVGGGEIPDERIAKYSAELPSDRCPGPYWIVGEVIAKQSRKKDKELENNSKIPSQSKENLSRMELQVISTKKLIKAPFGGFNTNFIYLEPGETKEVYYTFYTRNGGPGWINYKIDDVPTGLNVTIEPSRFMAQPHRNYTSKITLNASPEMPHTGPGDVYQVYTLYLQVNFEGENETIGDDWLRVVPYPIPGESLLYQPHGGLNTDSITLKPGETKNVYYTLHTGRGGIGKVNYSVYRISETTYRAYVKHSMTNLTPVSMPAGLNVTIDPSRFIARSFENYTSKITVKTTPELPPGEYILNIKVSYGRTPNNFLTVKVV